MPINDLHNWKRNMSFPKFELSYTDGENSAIYRGTDGYEKLYLPCVATTTGDISFTLKFKAPNSAPHWHDEYICILGNVPNTGDLFSNNVLGYTQISLDASDSFTEYTVIAQATQGDMVYICIDLGYLNDRTDMLLVWRDITVSGVRPLWIDDLSAWTRIGYWNRFNNDYLDGANYVIFNLAENSNPYKRLYFPIQPFGTYEYHLKISVRTPSGGRIQNESDRPKVYIVSNEPNDNWRPISYYGVQNEYEIPIEESTEFVTYDIPIHGNRTSDNEDYVVIEFSPFVNNFDMVYYFQDISFERYTNWIVEDGELVNKSQIEPIGVPISSVIPNLLMRCTDYMEEGYPYNKTYIDLVPVAPINPEENFDPIKFLSRIRVRSTPHGLNKTFPVTKMTIPLDDPGGATYNLGSKTTQSMTNHSAEINSQLLKQISDIPAPSSILQAAKDNASALIKETSNGYVTLMRNAEGLITEILICDRMNYLDPEAKIWRWNINGLGYSSTGYNGEFGLAMTMDGAIVANKITTGTMLADRIRGGNLIMGGLNNVAGTIIVNDEDGHPICVFNKAGGSINGKLYTRSEIETMQIDGQDKDVAFWMNLAEGHLYGGSSINGSESQIADINLRSQYDVDGHIEFGLGLNSNIIGINSKQVWVGNTTIGYMVALPQYETDIVTDISVTKDSDGKVTDINLTKKHLHFIHGMLTQVDDI